MQYYLYLNIHAQILKSGGTRLKGTMNTSSTQAVKQLPESPKTKSGKIILSTIHRILGPQRMLHQRRVQYRINGGWY